VTSADVQHRIICLLTVVERYVQWTEPDPALRLCVGVAITRQRHRATFPRPRHPVSVAHSFVGVASPLDSHSRSDHFFTTLLADPEAYSQQAIASIVRDGFESRVRGALCFDFFLRGWVGFALIHIPLYGGRATALS
jgi:hypothetical protein